MKDGAGFRHARIVGGTASKNVEYAQGMAKRPAANSDAKPSAKDDGPGGMTAEHRFVILHGKEAFLRQMHTQALRDALSKAHGAVDTVMFDGETASAAEVLDECRSFGLIASYKLVVVDNADDLVKESTRPMFEAYAKSLAESPDCGATLLLRTDTWRPGNLDKLVAAVGCVLKCESPDVPKAVAWVEKRAKKRHNSDIEPAAAALLVERVGTDLGRLDSELGKLAAATNEGSPIDTSVVSQFVGVSREEAVWDIQQKVLKAPVHESLGHLRNLLDVSREPAVLISWALTDLARKLHAASRAMAQGARPDTISKPLKLWGPSSFVILDAARAIKPAAAFRLYRQCVENDQRSKSGFGDAERTLERTVINYALARRG